MRAPLLLLMAAASLAATPLARLNPWLSACDLEEEGAAAAAAAARACSRAACSTREPLGVRDARALCATSTAEERQRRLHERRLRACCERDPLSALDARGRLEVAAGGARCERTLLDLIDLDAMASRVHCSFHDILDRYDCQQNYSVHTCDQCQETYRRWACSTLLPYFVSEEETERRGGEARTRRAGDGRGRARHLDRRRGGAGGVVGRWVRAAAAGPGRPRLLRLQPCLAVCQLVEQHCPYFLPGDRAPAYPTQYAGEPTFLCLDPRIPETEEQAAQSNYGAEECCYRHCGAGLCHRCEPRLRRYDEPPPARDTCAPPEQRVSTCVLPSSPAAPPPPPPAARAPARPAPHPALLAAALLLPLVLTARTDRTLLLVTKVPGARL